jgi:probable rRNA maturation factor
VEALEVEVIGAALPAREVRRLCELALAAVRVRAGHLAVAFVDAARIEELNAAHRDRPEPTDVLSFGVDEAGVAAGPRELGDVVICPAHTQDLREAVVHGVLHLAGLDHETDDGEMLALQDEVLRRAQGRGEPAAGRSR